MNITGIVNMILVSLLITIANIILIFMPICIALSFFIDFDVLRTSIIMGVGSGIYSLICSIFHNFALQR